MTTRLRLQSRLAVRRGHVFSESMTTGLTDDPIREQAPWPFTKSSGVLTARLDGSSIAASRRRWIRAAPGLSGEACHLGKAFLLLVVMSTVAPTAAWAQSPPAMAPPAISGIRAHLFQNKTATLSDDVSNPKSAGLWNSIAGPNAANAVLVVVEVSGPPGGTYTGHFGPHTKYLVRLVAQETGRAPRRLLDQSQTIPVLSDRGQVYLGFLIHQDGCAPVRLTATIVGQHAGKPFGTSLSFACGE